MKNKNSCLIALVDTNDNIIGYGDKLKVHKKGLLHRAFSVFIFNKKGDMLIHKRAHSKYHSPSLWTNACCSHLLKNTTMQECIGNRLQYEMGFSTEVKFQLKFTYHKNFNNGLTEHETDYIYTGVWKGTPNPNHKEVAAYKWISVKELTNDIKKHPENYTYWFKYIMEHFESKIKDIV
jgi:isopentenyl-diphosphate delta-isomerase